MDSIPLPSNIEQVVNDINQEHILSFWNTLTNNDRSTFISQLNSIDFNGLKAVYKKTMFPYGASGTRTQLDDDIEPYTECKIWNSTTLPKDTIERYYMEGLRHISEQRIGVILLAGGQGTRLGVSYPKGMVSIGLPSNKTLFQLLAERILCLQNITLRRIPNADRERTKIIWYIMTSELTHEYTKLYFQEENYFGLQPDCIVFFKQGLLPAFTEDGKLLLENKSSIVQSPDGNGGLYLALKQNHILDDMRTKGIQYLHVHSVDNVLTTVADPIFMGLCITTDADCGSKAVQRKDPKECVGLICCYRGKPRVVEYTELTEKLATLTDKNNQPVYNLANICNHFFTTEFLQRMADQYENELPLHAARKRISHIHPEDGTRIQPSHPNGIKPEKFIFDAFPFSENFHVLIVPRETEFSPVKNHDSIGIDCPTTARRDLLALHSQQILNAGGCIRNNCSIEISPLLSYCGENIEHIVKGKIFEDDTVLK